MKTEFVGSEALRTHYGLDDFNADVDYVEFYNSHFSAVSVETCLIYIVSTCAAALENMFDWFRQDVNGIVANERYGHKGWYETKAREFHYTDQETQEEVYPITQVSCEEQAFGIKLKVVKTGDEGLEPLTPEEEAAFQTWMNRQKPAGIPIHFVNRRADQLKLEMTVYYDPVKVAEGNVKDLVRQEIVAHLQGIDFNGVFTTMGLVDHLQGVEGLNIIEIHDARTKPDGENVWDQIENVTRDVPVSGWYELDEENTEITPVPLL